MSRKLQGGTSLGLEVFGNISERKHYVGPTIGLQLDRKMKFLAGYGFRTNGDPGKIRLLFEYEF